MSDPTPDQTEDAVSRALAARASEVTVSPDALDNIRDRRGRPSLAGRSLALAGIAAVVALLVGVAVVTRGDDTPDGIDIANDTSTTAPPSTTEPPDDPPDAVDPPDDEPDPAVERVQAGFAVWPTDDAGAPTAEAAARGWVEEVLGFDPDAVQAHPDQPAAADVGAFRLPFVGENGQPLEGGVDISVASPDNGEHWLVESVGTANLRIDLVERNGFGDGIRVTGYGDAFEGTGLLYVDGEGPTIVGLGTTVGDEFSVVVPWDGDGPVHLRLETGTAFEGQVPGVHAVAVDPGPASTNVVVVGVALDDVLNIRSGAGVDNDIVGTLDPFAGALTHTGAVDFVDGDEWWEILTTPDDPIRGWVNARFLSVQRNVDEIVATEMLAEAERFLTSFGSPDGERPVQHPNGVDVGGIGVFADAPTPMLRLSELWSESLTFDFDPFPDEPGLCETECFLTVREFLDVRERDVTDAEYVIGFDVDRNDPNFRFFTGLDPEQAGLLATVTASVPAIDDGELDWKRYIFTFDFVDGSPTVQSAWRWGWTP